MALDTNQVEKPIRKLRKLLKKMPADPTPKQVHDLRTNSRKFEAILQAAEPDGNGRKILKQISYVRRRAGKVRDMDVLTRYAAELPIKETEEDCSVRLLEHLGSVREKKTKKLSKAAHKSAPELRKRLKRISPQLQKRVGGTDSTGDETPSHITSAALQLISELEQPSSLNKSNLHPYRLKVKELQNLLRLGQNGRHQEFAETLGEVKDAIGEWHDWVELHSIAQKTLDHPQCDLIRELKKRSDQRFERALALAEHLRKKYLGASARLQRGKRRPPRPAESVWSATSALTA